MVFLNSTKKMMLCCIIVSGTGCSLMPSHIHSAEQLASAEKIKTVLSSYAEHSPTMYQTMITNLGRFEVEENRVIGDFFNNYATSVISNMPNKTLKKLWVLEDSCSQESTIMECKVRNNISAVENAVVIEANRYLTQMQVLNNDLDTANAAIKAAKNALTAAKENVTNWNATLALLKKGLSELPSTDQETQTESVKDDIKKQLKDIGDREVEFVNADGKTIKESIATILSEQLLAKNNEGQVALNLPDAPGNTVVILTLGLELAEIQKRRATYRMTQLAARAELYEDIFGSAILAKNLVNDSLKGDIGGMSEKMTLERFMINKSTLSRAAQQKLNQLSDPTNKIFINNFKNFNSQRLLMASMLTKVRNLVLSDLIATRAKNILELSVTRLNHQESIQISSINDQAYLAAQMSAANSLVTYHKGGFTGEDAANIISIAQAIALGVIAGGV